MKSISIISLLFLSFSALSQNFFNLDFEYEAEPGQPKIWYVEGEDQFSANLVSHDFHGGRQSFAITVGGGQAVTYLSLPGSLVVGKTVAIRGFLKGITNDGMQLMIAFKDPRDAKPNIFPVALEGLGEWKAISAEMNFKSYPSDLLLLAIIVAGNGKVLIDDFRLTIGDVEIRDGLPDPGEPSTLMLKTLNSEIISLDALSPLASKEFQDIVGHARIIALGENSHGSASIYETKLQIIQRLITDEGFNVFALECPSEEANKVDAYVQGENVFREEILRSLVYPAWKTKEMLNIIEWMRQYNKTNKKSIRFAGFDIVNKQGIDRDRVMADAIKRMVDHSIHDKFILSGDNTHITKATGKMGSYLSDWYKSAYLAIGFTFGNGTYAAYGPNPYYDVHKPYAGTCEYILDKLKFRNFILDLHKPQVKEYFGNAIGFRSIGSRPQETTQFAQTVLRDHFDAIVYLGITRHTTFLSE